MSFHVKRLGVYNGYCKSMAPQWAKSVKMVAKSVKMKVMQGCSRFLSKDFIFLITPKL